MDPSEFARLSDLLSRNPNERSGLAALRRCALTDPVGAVQLLVEVAGRTQDDRGAAQCLLKAARISDSGLHDQVQMAEFLAMSVDRDPCFDVPVGLLAKYFRAVGDNEALVAFHERRASALTELAHARPALRNRAAALWLELMAECMALGDRPRALSACRRVLDLDPTCLQAIRFAKDASWEAGRWSEVVAFSRAECSLVTDLEEKLHALRGLAEGIRMERGAAEACAVLREARALDESDFGIAEDLANLVLDRFRHGQPVDEQEKREATSIYVQLAEMHEGEISLAMALHALDVMPGDDRGIELAWAAASALGKRKEVERRWPAYLEHNPGGGASRWIRAALAQQYESSGRLTEALDVLLPMHDGSDDGLARRLKMLFLRTGRIDELLEMMERRAGQAPVREKKAILQEMAKLLQDRHRDQDAADRFEQLLEIDPLDADALAFASSFQRSHGQFARARELLMNAVAVPKLTAPLRKKYLREIASLSEGPLHDLDEAVAALGQLCVLDRTDASAREDLKRLLVRAERWDDYIGVLEHELEATAAAQEKVAVLKRIAGVHELKRVDFLAAARTWERTAALTPDDGTCVIAAMRLYEKSSEPGLARRYLAATVTLVRDPAIRTQLYRDLGEMCEREAFPSEAGDAYAQEAALSRDPKAWRSALRCFVHARLWLAAANACAQLRSIAVERAEQASLLLREASFLDQGGRPEEATARIQTALMLTPDNESASNELDRRLTAAGQHAELAAHLLQRAELLHDATQQAKLRKRAAWIQAESLGRPDIACSTLQMVVEACEDAEALAGLAALEERSGRPLDAARWLLRLVDATTDRTHKVTIALRRAELLATSLQDVAAAIVACEAILRDIDGSRTDVLVKISELERARGNLQGMAAALERAARQVGEPDAAIELWTRAAFAYEEQLDNPAGAITCFEAALAIRNDRNLRERLAALYRAQRRWESLMQTLQCLIEDAPDADYAATLALEASEVLERQLNNVDGALALLADRAAAGCPRSRARFTEIGDRNGRSVEVAWRLLAWSRTAPSSPARDQGFIAAFERFASSGMFEDAGTALLLIAAGDSAEGRDRAAASLSHIELAARQSNALAVFLRACEEAWPRAETAEQRLVLARHVARLYLELPPDPQSHMRCLEALCDLDPVDLPSRRTLAELYEHAAQWRKLADILGSIARAECDPAVISSTIVHRATVLESKLDAVQEALEVLCLAADAGDEACREALVRMGDANGRSSWVADRLLQWNAVAPDSEARTRALVGAFERYVGCSQLASAAMAVSRMRTDGPSYRDILVRLEQTALAAGDADVLSVAHERLAVDLEGLARATELVRQVEQLARIQEDLTRAMQAAERGFGGLPLSQVEPLLRRILALIPEPEEQIGLYERQVARCASSAERIDAIGLAAGVAFSHGAVERCRRLLALGVGAAPAPSDIDRLEQCMAEIDARNRSTQGRRVFAEALAAAPDRGNDGGQTRAAFLRRAARIAHRDLGDEGLTVDWFGEAIFARLEGALHEKLGDLDAELQELRAATTALMRLRARAESPSWHGHPLMRGSAQHGAHYQAGPEPSAQEPSDALPAPGDAPEMGPDDALEVSVDLDSEELTCTSFYQPSALQEPLSRISNAPARPPLTPLLGMNRSHSAPASQSAGSVPGDCLSGTRGADSTPDLLEEPSIAGTFTGAGRGSPEDLVIDLFEAVFELRFQSDARSGSQFIAKLVAERLAGAFAIVHWFEPDERRYTIAHAIGPGAHALEGLSTPADDPLLTAARRSRSIVVCHQHRGLRFLQGERWKRIRIPLRSVLCATVQLDGDLLGAIEIASGRGGVEFDDGSAMALVYVAERFAEFLVRTRRPGPSDPG